MAALGVVEGYNDGTFRPNAALNRQQAARVLANLAEAIGKPLASYTATFTDADSIADWAVSEVGQVQGSDIMSGSDGNFNPTGPYTRQQSITTMLRLFNFIND
jgi:hypothetical protein